MVYICYIIYRDYVIMCVLAVGDDELAVGDDELAVGRVVGGCRGKARAGGPRNLTWRDQWRDPAIRFRASGF
jgi:hypothetical protein